MLFGTKVAEKHVVISESTQAEHLEIYCSFLEKIKVKASLSFCRLHHHTACV